MGLAKVLVARDTPLSLRLGPKHAPFLHMEAPIHGTATVHRRFPQEHSRVKKKVGLNLEDSHKKKKVGSNLEDSYNGTVMAER